MAEFLSVIVLVVIFARWVFTRERLTQIKEQLEGLRTANSILESQVAQLTRRVFDLEHGHAASQQGQDTTAAPALAPRAEVAIAAPHGLVLVPPLPAPVAPPPITTPDLPAPALPAEPEEQAAPAPVVQTMAPPRRRFSSADIEALVGGNLLPKVGVLVLVVGIALLLGYSLTQFGPVGKVVVGFIVSLAMLGGGIVIERRERYAVFGRALIAGGWAGVYFTTYAMYALDAARIIESPAVGTMLLLAVAVAMILHALRYRSEALTGLTFFTAYLALAITAVGGTALIATVPLTVFLAGLAWRNNWTRLAAAGIVYSYGTYIVQHAGPPPQADLLLTQAVLWIYWLIFEAYDQLTLSDGSGWRYSLLPLNACGFIGAAILPGSPFTSPASLNHFLTFAAAALAAGAVVRAVRGGGDETERRKFPLHPWELAIAASAGVMVAVIFRQFSGNAVNVALLIEAEFLVLSGVILRRRFLERLGAVVLILPVGKLLMMDAPEGKWVRIWGRSVQDWTPAALGTIAVLGANRWITRSLPIYSYVATGLLAMTLGVNLEPRYIGVAWLALAMVLFELRVFTGLGEFRWQSYGLGAIALVTLLVVKFLGLGVDVARYPWRTVGVTGLITYAATARVLLLAAGKLGERERRNLLHVVSSAAALMVALLAWYVLPAPLIAMGWMALALILFEAAPLIGLPLLRPQAHLLAAASLVRLVLSNLNTQGETWILSHRLLTVAPSAAVFYYFCWRLVNDGGRRRVAGGYFYAGWFLLIALFRFELGRAGAVLGWSALMLVLVVLGVRRSERQFRYQAYLTAALVFGRSWATNFFNPESLLGVRTAVWTGALVVGGLYGAQFLMPRRPLSDSGNLARRLDRHARQYFSILATGLLAILLFVEVSGQLLTVALGLEGIVLLVLGFPLRERVFRLSGLALFLFCIGKLFFYDLRNLDTLSRIISFIALGLLMVGGSWLYSKFRERVRTAIGLE
jgi:hypothetical protein